VRSELRAAAPAVASGRAGWVTPVTPVTVGEVMASISALSVPGVLNIYDEEESVRWGDPPGQATSRRRALHRYLTSHWSAPTVLVGEAPGKNGARRTGLPFTSMRQMTGEGPAEPTATIVQRVLAELGQQDRVLLWNASILFAPDNRNPRREEIDACANVLALICRGRKVLAIGRHAETATGAPYIRHPSHGGSSLFTDGLRASLSAEGLGASLSVDGLRASLSVDGLRASLSSAPPRGPWSGGDRPGDVASSHPVGTLDVTMRSQPSRRRRDSPPLPGRRPSPRG
jgi:uracil-DNA glycosylase